MVASLKINARTTNGESVSRTYRRITTQYLTIGSTAPALDGYDGFYEWADTVARSLNGLSTKTFIGADINIEIDLNEEVD